MINNKLKRLIQIYLIIFSGIITTLYGATAYKGYIFCASGQTAYLLDPSGKTVHTWKASGSARACAYLLPDGSAIFPLKTSCPVKGDGAYPHGRLQKISWEGKIVWDAVVCNETYTPGYDLAPMPNGNFLVAGASKTSGLKIEEIQPVGASEKKVIWEYYLPDSLGNNGYINSLCYNPELKQIGIDINRAKKLVVIDYETKSIVYTYPITSGVATHGAHWVIKSFLGTDIVMPDADINAMRINNLLVVNNSLQAVEINPRTGTLVKKIPFKFSAHEGSVQRLPNGNTLVNSASNSATEIDDNGKKIRTITLPGKAARAYMYGPTYPGIKINTGHAKSWQPKASGMGRFVYNSLADKGRITLSASEGSLRKVQVHTVSGKTIFSVAVRGMEAHFSTHHLLPGIYFVFYNTTLGSFNVKFIKN